VTRPHEQLLLPLILGEDPVERELKVADLRASCAVRGGLAVRAARAVRAAGAVRATRKRKRARRATLGERGRAGTWTDFWSPSRLATVTSPRSSPLPTGLRRA